jgi:NADPH:quinone reductase-like Zn-dependent oxidoreductase/NADP-dependent 3-hydroxy acid dehydrogenase YdfG/acyl carrier protein
MYEGPAGDLGSEFVGTVVSRGEGVTLEVGCEVMGMAGGAFRSYLCVPADTVAAVPAGLSIEEAATLPVVFLTALYGLEHLAALRHGERVLIHAGTGGVGLAAIQVARRIGAEVFATAGSDEKRDYLRALGVRHVFSSRTLEFGDGIRAATGSEGIDVVLNSLNGDFIAESLGLLRQGGRFVEIGKAGIWGVEQMAAARPDIRYFPVYLGDVDSVTQQALYEDLRSAIAAGTLRALPRRSYSLAEAPQAFRFMAQARHIGKLVLTAPNVDVPAIRADGTYLVTGAFGGLGAQVARWLVDQGARRLALVGRQGAASRGGAELVAELEARGAVVDAHAADVGDARAMDRVFGALDATKPLRGVIHAAGVLDDGVLQQQSLSRLATVFGPKVAGAWTLHQHTKNRPLDFFVMFSSMVTIVGAPGQGNYAAANATLDALAHYRRASGVPGVTINWGPWADTGMSAAVSQQDRQRWQRQGISFMTGPQGLAALGRLIHGASPQVAVLPLQWRVLFQQFPAGGLPPLYAELAEQLSMGATAARPADVDLGALLRDVPAARIPGVVVRHITELAFKVLGLDDATVMDPHRPLQEYGLDSLMAVELRNALGGLVGRTLPATLLFKYPTVQALADHVLESLPRQAVAAPEAGPIAAADVAEIGSLSDDEVKRMLADELASLSAGGWSGDDDRTDA